MELASSWQDTAVSCFDPECRGVAEPEQDGDRTYYECTACGYAFGYQKVQTGQLAVGKDGTCAAGIPENLRRQASAAMEGALAGQQRKEPLLLQIGRRPNDSVA